MSGLTILLIRHAEKPEDPKLGPGVTLEGEEDKHSLVIRGWQRAGAWACLFGSDRAKADFPQPDFVYAANPANVLSTDGSASKRPYETIRPLCDRLQLDPNTTFAAGDESALVQDLLRLSGVVLICWEHKRIVQTILPAITQGQALATLPTKWAPDRFDVLLRLDRPESDLPWSFRQLFPQLLGGDSAVPL